MSFIDSIKDFFDEHPILGTLIVLLSVAVVIGIIVVIVLFVKKNKSESFVEHYVGTDQYDDQYKYAESYINSVLGL